MMNTSGPLVMLTFHGLGSPGRVLPNDEYDVWLEPDDFCAVLDEVKGRDDVVITFDDGNRSDCEIAMPALLERGMRGIFFLTAGHLDEPGYLRTQDVHTLAQSGMVIGNHGMHHRSWRGMTDDDAREELVAARSQLESAAGQTIAVAACPFGRYDRGAVAHLQRAGYEHVVTSDGGATSSRSWLQPRNTLRRDQDRPALLHRLLYEHPSSWQSLKRSARLLAKRWR
jgi:peptidoglycan/xylan/chitin deacetylase (PgdA/CDA1 family)